MRVPQAIDVGAALEVMLYDDSTVSQTFELYGPKNYSMAEIAELVDREIYKKRRHINVPKAALKPLAGLLNRFVWWPIMSADEIEREYIDQQIDRTAKTFKELGIEPGDISKFTYHYLVRPARSTWQHVSRDERPMLTPFCSRDSVARRTMIFRRQRTRRRERRGNTCTSLTTSESQAGNGLCESERARWAEMSGLTGSRLVECTYRARYLLEFGMRGQ